MDINEVFKDIVDGISEVRSYSGRGMYGKECLGVNTDNVFRTFADISQGIHDYILSEMDDEGNYDSSIEKLWGLLNNAESDSMGLGSIIYFPKVKWDENWN